MLLVRRRTTKPPNANQLLDPLFSFFLREKVILEYQNRPKNDIEEYFEQKREFPALFRFEIPEKDPKVKLK